MLFDWFLLQVKVNWRVMIEKNGAYTALTLPPFHTKSTKPCARRSRSQTVRYNSACASWIGLSVSIVPSWPRGSSQRTAFKTKWDLVILTVTLACKPLIPSWRIKATLKGELNLPWLFTLFLLRYDTCTLRPGFYLVVVEARCEYILFYKFSHTFTYHILRIQFLFLNTRWQKLFSYLCVDVWQNFFYQEL